MKALLTILMLACSVCSGQIQPIPVRVDHPSQPASPTLQTGLWNIGPMRQIDRSRYTETLADIEERIQENNVYRVAGDPTTSAHEMVHGINSNQRQNLGAGIDVFYMGKDKAWVLRLPNNITLGDVANRVPQGDRQTNTYDLYLVKARVSPWSWI